MDVTECLFIQSMILINIIIIMLPEMNKNYGLGFRGRSMQQTTKTSTKGLLVKPNKSKNASQEYSPLNIEPIQLNSMPSIDYNRNRLRYSRHTFEGQKQKISEREISEKKIKPLMLTIGKQEEQLVKKRIQTNLEHKVKRNHRHRKCTCGDCEDCLKDFTYFLQIFSTDHSLPEISAKSWCIWIKGKNNKFMQYYGKRVHKIREIASLTKMLTAMITLDFLARYQLDPNRITYEPRKSSITIGGTSAQLEIGEVYTISELLYGLMLPSGNDAAIALSQVIGLMHNLKLRNKCCDFYTEKWYCQYLTNLNKSYAYHFINLMNQKCQKLGLLETKVFNSHGNDAYYQLKNISTCNQVARISAQFMTKYEELRKVVLTKDYTVQRYNKKWENTNKLLQDGFQGIKTGITETAGPCLSACYKNIIIVVLNSKSMNQRWIQVKKLVRWIIRKGL